MRILLIILIIALLPINVLAEDCNTNLTKDSNYQDINIILNCLNDKIKDLEDKVNKLNSYDKTATQNIEHPILDNESFTVHQVRINRSSNRVYLSFIITSKSGSNILMALDRHGITVTEQSGNAWKYSSLSGMNCVSDNDIKESWYSVLNPGVPTPVSIEFMQDYKGKKVAFKVRLFLLKDGKQVSYSFGKSAMDVDG